MTTPHHTIDGVVAEVVRLRAPELSRVLLHGVLVMLTWLCLGAAHARADEFSFATTQIDPELLRQLDRRGDLTLRDTSLSDALLTISESWKVNIVVGNDVNGQVSGVFRDTTLREVLGAILDANGYTYRPVGRSLVISRQNDKDVISPFFQTATIPIGVATPEELVEGARLLASPQGRVQAVASANSLLVFDTPDRIAVIRRFVSQMDRAARQAATQSAIGTAAMETANFKPQYVDAESLKDVVQSLVSKEGKVGMMSEENRLIVLDYPHNLQLIRETIATVDQPRPQVRITAFIYDLSIEDIEKLGINWSSAGKFGIDSSGEATKLLGIDSVLSVPAAAGEAGSSLTLMNLSKNIDVTGVVNALKQLTNARLLADPTVTVIDREQATIQIVTEIPFQQLTQTSNGGDIGTTAFREAGVKLNVSPKIANDGTLLLEVNPSFSRLTGFTSGASAAPIIDKRETTTTVRVTNGQTLVIGGLRQRSDTRDRKGVPYLKDRKYVGHLFRGRSDTVRESELVVFITPEIIMPNCDQQRPREWAAEARTRGELQRIPVAPEMVWPNTYGFDYQDGTPDQHYSDHQMIHPHDPRNNPTPVIEQPIPARPRPTPMIIEDPMPGPPVEDLIVPELGLSGNRLRRISPPINDSPLEIQHARGLQTIRVR